MIGFTCNQDHKSSNFLISSTVITYYGDWPENDTEREGQGRESGQEKEMGEREKEIVSRWEGEIERVGGGKRDSQLARTKDQGRVRREIRGVEREKESATGTRGSRKREGRKGW